MQVKHNMKKRKNILLLSILLNLIYCEVSGQTYNSFKNEVVLKIEELLDSKLVNSESDTKAYDFKIDTSEIKIRGVRQILEFDYRYKKKKIFKSINRKNTWLSAFKYPVIILWLSAIYKAKPIIKKATDLT